MQARSEFAASVAISPAPSPREIALDDNHLSGAFPTLAFLPALESLVKLLRLPILATIREPFRLLWFEGCCPPTGYSPAAPHGRPVASLNILPDLLEFWESERLEGIVFYRLGMPEMTGRNTRLENT